MDSPSDGQSDLDPAGTRGGDSPATEATEACRADQAEVSIFSCRSTRRVSCIIAHVAHQNVSFGLRLRRASEADPDNADKITRAKF